MLSNSEVMPCACALQTNRGARLVCFRPTPYTIIVTSIAIKVSLADPSLPRGSLNLKTIFPAHYRVFLSGDSLFDFPFVTFEYPKIRFLPARLARSIGRDIGVPKLDPRRGTAPLL